VATGTYFTVNGWGLRWRLTPTTLARRRRHGFGLVAVTAYPG